MMSESGMMGVASLEMLDKMKSWAVHPAMAANLVQDETIMGGLVLALSHSDQAVVDKVLQILLLLSENMEYRTALKDSIGMMDQLLAIMARGQPSQAETAHLIEQRLHHQPLQEREKTHPNAGHHQPNPMEKKKRRNSFFIGSVAKSRMIILQVRGLNDRYDAEAARNSLIRVKGVISITFDLKAKRVILRTKPDLRPELLAAAIARTMTMCADQVVKDENGEEHLVSFGQHAESVNKENEDLPEYPDDTSPVRGDKNMARLGDSTPGKSDGYSFIKSVGSFLSNSFYW